MGVQRKRRLGAGWPSSAAGILAALIAAVDPLAAWARPWLVVHAADSSSAPATEQRRLLAAALPDASSAFALRDAAAGTSTLLITGADEPTLRALPSVLAERIPGLRAWMLEEVEALACTAPAAAPTQGPVHLRYFPFTVAHDRESRVVDELEKRAGLCRTKPSGAAYAVLRAPGDEGAVLYVLAMAGTDGDAVTTAHAGLANAFGWRGRAVARALEANWRPLEPIGGTWLPDEDVGAAGAAPVPLVAGPRVAPVEPLSPDTTVVAETQAEVAVAEPLSEPVAVAEPLESERREPLPAARGDAAPRNPSLLTTTVRRWAAAWARQDVEAYLGFYASDFVPASGASRDAWVASRRRRLEAPAFIQVRVDGLVAGFDQPDRAWVTFVQEYRSDRFTDRVLKRLDLVWERNRWRIAAERVVDEGA